jgi:peptidoglycan/LPS O-acetylase OafA/YrhL
MRFFAALWVLLFHLRIHLGSPKPLVLERLLQAGPLAMSFFFVLSGFILAVSSLGKEPWADYSGYLWRRASRIYPIYLTYLILFWSVIGFAGNLGSKPVRTVALLGVTDLTLSNAWFPQLFLGGFGRDGSWSLSVEVFFYALFPLVLMHARQLSDKVLLRAIYWSVGLAAVGPILGKYLPGQGVIPETVYYSLPIYRLPEFTAGVFYAVWILRNPSRLPTGKTVVWTLLGLVLYLCLAARALPYAGNDIVLVPALLVLFGYFLREDSSWLARALSTRPMVFLGEISFGIYLMQIFTINLYLQPGHGAEWLGGAAGCLGLTILLAAISHLFIEKPARSWMLSRKTTL